MCSYFDYITEKESKVDWGLTYAKFKERCDSLSEEPVKNNRQQMEYLKKKGHFIADTFYMANPYSYMGFEHNQPCNCYFYNGILFIYMNSDLQSIPKDFFKNLKIEVDGKEKDFDESVITELPIVIIQGNQDLKIGSDEPYPNEKSIWSASDLVVFRGVFRAIDNGDPEKYDLQKIWDKFYFDAPIK